MTDIRAGVVEVVVLEDRRPVLRTLLLRRAAGTRCTGAWEVVYGRIDPGEKPDAAAIRELLEETGFALKRLYSIYAHPFYLPAQDTVQIALVFAAFVDDEPVRLSAEHDLAQWLSFDEAIDRVSWPRSRTALRDVRMLLGSGDAGPVEDVLRLR